MAKVEDKVLSWWFAHSRSKDPIGDLVTMVSTLVQEEREACAVLCDDVAELRAGYANSTPTSHRQIEHFAAETARSLAARIRERKT